MVFKWANVGEIRSTKIDFSDNSHQTETLKNNKDVK